MTRLTSEAMPVSFSPGLPVSDELASYWLRQVTLRLRREVWWCWRERGLTPDSVFSDATKLPPYTDKAVEAVSMARRWEERVKFFEKDSTAHYLSERLLDRPPMLGEEPKRGSFSWVVSEIGLDDASAFVLALGLSVYFDNAVGSVIAACLNDPLKTHPTFALAQKLWDYPEQIPKLGNPGHLLFSLGLIAKLGQNASDQHRLDWDDPLHVPQPVAQQLLDSDLKIDDSLEPIEPDEQDIGLGSARILSSRLKQAKNSLQIVPMRGAKGSAHAQIACSIAAASEQEVVEFNGDPRLLQDKEYLNALATVCWLRGVHLFLGQDVVASLSVDSQRPESLTIPLNSIPLTIFLAITDRKQLATIPSGLLLPIVDVPKLSYQDRIEEWKRGLGEKSTGLERIIPECSRQFRFEKESIRSICKGLASLEGRVTETDLLTACRAELELDLGDLAQRIIPRFKDEELILPAKQLQQFREIENAMRSLTEVHYNWGTAEAWNESGISVLFAGPPGAGKTMAAEILALKLGLPMYLIDLSQVVNKYIGETEKNLKRLFDAADATDSVLFFDEADSLFGRRTEVKDAHDRYANLEISYLLERMERFKGLAILATNRKKDLDEGFLRRLRYIIDFPFPGEEQRLRIWHQVIPKSVDTSEVNFDFLAKQFQLTGGHIRSIAFNACLQSAGANTRGSDVRPRLTMEKVIVAVKREYEKLNRSISPEQFGEYARYFEEVELD